MADEICEGNPGYGFLYGEYYGGCPSEFEQLIISRLLMFTRQDFNLPMLTRIFSSRAESHISFADSITEAFDITTAEGHRLDILGSILQVSRQGLNDERYRKRLQIQIEILLTSGGTTTAVINTVETWTGAVSEIYFESYPAAFVISAQLPEEEFAYLAEMIKLAKPGGVWASVLMAPAEDGLICDSVVDPLTDPGELDSAVAPTGVAKVMGTVYTL